MGLKMECSVCGSGDECFTCASLLGPISLSYCGSCSVQMLEPEFLMDYVLEETCGEVSEHIKNIGTIVNGVNMTWEEFVVYKMEGQADGVCFN